VAAFGREFRNPLGLAAGFDKDAEGAEALLNLGFGFIEVGSITPLPQPGNPKPRVFRVPSQAAIINRYGFNSKGHEPALKLISEFRARFPIDSSPPPAKGTLLSAHHPPAPGRLGINLGKNKAQEDASQDYAEGARRFAPLADFLVVNVSSPNTPGLRALQGKKALTDLLRAAVAARDAGVKEAGVVGAGAAAAGRGAGGARGRTRLGGIFSSSSSASSAAASPPRSWSRSTRTWMTPPRPTSLPRRSRPESTASSSATRPSRGPPPSSRLRTAAPRSRRRPEGCPAGPSAKPPRRPSRGCTG
jgi:hypothetical protein